MKSVIILLCLAISQQEHTEVRSCSDYCSLPPAEKSKRKPPEGCKCYCTSQGCCDESDLCCKDKNNPEAECNENPLLENKKGN